MGESKALGAPALALRTYLRSSKALVALLMLSVFLLASACATQAGGQRTGAVREFELAYPSKAQTPLTAQGTTHEITYHPKSKAFWIAAQNYDAVVRLTPNGKPEFLGMPKGSGPHSLEFDALDQLWVAFESLDKVARLSPDGSVLAEYDVRLDCAACPEKVHTHPHGLGIGADGRTIWYTGKLSGTLGRITPDGKVQSFALQATDSAPIYIRAGPDGNMWFTELVGNRIGRVTPDGKVQEFTIPTPNSRPIAIVPEPGGQAMWFTEEAGKVGRIAMDGTITEYIMPKAQANVLLAGLGFDHEKNLWVAQYVDQNHATPPGVDRIIKIDRSILTTGPSDFAKVPLTFYEVPTRNTVLHRIIVGPDGNMWFTELKADKIGMVTSK